MPPSVRGIRAAVTFLTRVPVGGYPYSADDMRWASAHFPLVGAAVGLAMGVVLTLALPLDPLVAASLAIAAGLLITGAFHEDGLADTADALGGAYDPSRVLEILKDSRIGAFGGLAIAVSILLRAALLAALAWRGPVALVVAHTVSRALPVWMMVAMPYVTADEHSRSRLLARAGVAQAFVATCWTLLVLAVAAFASPLGGRSTVTAVAVAVALAVFLSWRFHRRVGGVTGDFLGATQQVCECGVLIALLAAS